jgi:anthranilate phosphoribosyltransferase
LPNSVVTLALDALASRRHLSMDEAAGVLHEVMAGNASEAQTAAVLIALRTKGETVEEIAGLARTMRALARTVEVPPHTRAQLVDTAGTGGGRPTFNVSTTAALIAAGAGCRVAKHGNRSATGLSGSADVLEALGVRIDIEPEDIAQCIAEVGFGFMFAPAHHGATRWVVPVRKELGVRTIFNFLGPLTNPAGATRQVIGVSDRRFQETMAVAVGRLGARRALVVSSADGLDEISTSGVTHVAEIDGEELRRYDIVPEDVGLRRAGLDAVGGGTPQQNAEVTRRILGGELGARRDFAAINAGAAIYVAGLAESLEAGVREAEATLDSGAAQTTLERLIELTGRLASRRTQDNRMVAGRRVSESAA